MGLRNVSLTRRFTVPAALPQVRAEVDQALMRSRGSIRVLSSTPSRIRYCSLTEEPKNQVECTIEMAQYRLGTKVRLSLDYSAGYLVSALFFRATFPYMANRIKNLIYAKSLAPEPLGEYLTFSY